MDVKYSTLYSWWAPSSPLSQKSPFHVASVIYYRTDRNEKYGALYILPECIASIYIYYTTLLKSVQITSKTSTNIQQYSDSWLFVHFRFDEFVFSQSNFVSAAVLHVC